MKKKIIYALMLCSALFATTSCEKDYEEATSKHFYSEGENRPVKGTADNLVTASTAMAQANAETEMKSIDLTVYEEQFKTQMGMTMDEAIAALGNGSVKFLLVNPSRNVWDHTAPNAGDNKWNLSPYGIVTNGDDAAISVEFVAASKQLNFQLTKNAVPGIIPVILGFAKTDDNNYTTNFRVKSLITVTDASVVEVSVSVPQGDYSIYQLPLADFAANIDFAFGVTPAVFSMGLDTADPKYDVYLMDVNGNEFGGPGTYTSNGAGYWLTENFEIINWGAEGFAMFLEPNIWDYDLEDYYTDGGYINVGRLSNTAPASGSVIKGNLVFKAAADKTKTLTLMLTINFE